MKQVKKIYLKYFSALSIHFFLTLQCNLAIGQIKPDQTLGVESSTLNTGLVKDKVVDVIGGGSIRGSALLHSFQDFNILPNGGAYFINPLMVSNIVVRITGINKSSLLGTLGVLGNANLFLLNPNGIIFNSSTNLDLKGSFIASTANGVKFANSYIFSTTGGNEPPVEPLYKPIELEFSNNQSGIQVLGTGHDATTSEIGLPVSQGTSVGLKMGKDQTLALVAGEITFNGGTISSDSGKIQIASVKSGKVGINFANDGLLLNFSGVSEAGDINLLNKSLVNEDFSSLNIYGSNILISNGSFLWIKNGAPNLDSETIITATGSLKINGFNSVRSGYINEAISTNGSDLKVNAESISISDYGALGTSVLGYYKSGNIEINANSLLIKSGGLVSGGSRGDIQVKVKNDINIDGYNQIGPLLKTFNNVPAPTGIVVNTVDFGNSGNLDITANNLNIVNGGNVGSLTLGKGNSGVTFININDSINVTGVDFQSLYPSAINAATFGKGNAGELRIKAKNISILNGGRIDTSTLSYGNAGDIIITASNQIQVDGQNSILNYPSLIDSSATILDSALINAFNLPPAPTGDAGTLRIKTPNLSILNNGIISVQNQGTGDSGKIDINTTFLTLNKGGGIVGSTNSGRGGNIDIQSNAILLKNKSFITSSALGSGLGGNIKIKSDIFAGDTTSGILARAISMQGGNISLDAYALIVPNDFIISTSSQLGSQFNGLTRIEPPKIKLDSTNNTKVSFQTTKYIDVVCNGSVANKQAEFVNVTSGSIPPDVLSTLNGISGWFGYQRALPSEPRSIIKPNLEDMPEAQNISIGSNGTMSLSSDSKNLGFYHSSMVSYCH